MLGRLYVSLVIMFSTERTYDAHLAQNSLKQHTSLHIKGAK